VHRPPPNIGVAHDAGGGGGSSADLAFEFDWGRCVAKGSRFLPAFKPGPHKPLTPLPAVAADDPVGLEAVGPETVGLDPVGDLRRALGRHHPWLRYIFLVWAAEGGGEREGERGGVYGADGSSRAVGSFPAESPASLSWPLFGKLVGAAGVVDERAGSPCRTRALDAVYRDARQPAWSDDVVGGVDLLAGLSRAGETSKKSFAEPFMFFYYFPSNL
jgi:hypothetical protein